MIFGEEATMKARLYFATVILLAMAAMAVSQERQERERIQLQRVRLEQTSVALQPGEKVICLGPSASNRYSAATTIDVPGGPYLWIRILPVCLMSRSRRR